MSKPSSSDVKVLLISPGNSCRPDGNFGDPHLVALGSFLQDRCGVKVEIVDLDYERYLPGPDPGRIFSRNFAVVGISCYSSYDYLTAFYLGREIRRQNPGAVLVTGGYHPSARPGDFLPLPGSELDEPSPFDHVIVGEGELPLARVVEAAARGERLPEKVLGPEPLADLDELPPLDWSLLERYREAARSCGGQMTMSLSRGCPFHCSFCMERSKGESSWRAWSPERAERELIALDRWLGIRGWKLFIADAVFGLKPDWRREMLDRIARLELGFDKTWTLSRIDLIGPGDMERYRRANFGIGFGLESGDPAMLRLIAKTASPEAFLDRFLAFAAEAARAGLPWGANIICGHPGETAETLANSARFVRRLFLETDGLTGFLSVDPFRLYPGSQVDRQLDWYAGEFGTQVHRRRWWNYSEQAFTCEWIDPSRELDHRQRESLTAELFEPIVVEIARRFAYRGSARDYFLRSVTSARDYFRPAHRLRTLADFHLWRRLTGTKTSRLADDGEAAGLFRRGREETVARIRNSRAGGFPERIIAAVIDEPRERYVPDDHVLSSWQDVTIPLTGDGSATLSAIHAYLVNYTLLDLREGDQLVEIGGGTGYGAAVAARIVGDRGHVTTFEVAAELAAAARQYLRERANVTVVTGDGLQPERLPEFNKVLFTCAIGEVPQAYLDALPDGGRLLAPLLVDELENRQVLTLYVRTGDRIDASEHGAVRYVRSRSRQARRDDSQRVPAKTRAPSSRAASSTSRNAP